MNLRTILHVSLLFSFLTAVVMMTNAQENEFVFNKKVNYQVTFLSDSTDENSRQTMPAELLLNDTNSLFWFLNKSIKDEELTKPNAFPSPSIGFAPGLVNNENYVILKNKDGEITVYDEYSGSDLRKLMQINVYKERINPEDWQLTEETDTVMGLAVQKAVLQFGGRTWEAFFAPELPIADGPYKFNGLPGLILRIQDRTKSWVFEAQDIKEVDQKVVVNNKKDLKVVPIEKKELYSQRRKFQQDQVFARQGEGDGGIESAENRKQAEERIKKDNNWIELN